MSVDEMIKELESLPKIVYCGNYQRRLSPYLLDAIIVLLKEQEEKIADLENTIVLMEHDVI